MLQKRIKIPSKKIISPKSTQHQSKKNIKLIPKAESAKKNQNINPDLLIDELENNNQKNTTITTETNTTEDKTKKIYIYHKNLGKQKNTLIQKNSKKSIIRVISHEQINSKKNSRYNSIEIKELKDDTNEMKYETLNNINKINKNTNLNMNFYLQSKNKKNKNLMLYSDKNILEKDFNNMNFANNRNFNYINNINNYFYTQNLGTPMNSDINNNNININNNFNYDKKVKNVIIKRKELINIEDILLLEEKFFDVHISINTKSNISNECFEFINFYNQSSLYNKLETYFKEYQARNIVHCSIILTIFNLILIYHLSFNIFLFSNYSNLFSSIIKMCHQSFLLICNYISNKVSSSEKDNIWVIKLRNMLNNNIKHLDTKNNKDFEMFIIKKNLKNSDLSIPLIEINYYIYSIQKILTIILENLPNKDEMKSIFIYIFNNLFEISSNELNNFFNKKIFRILNKNASIGIISDISLYNKSYSKMKVPFLPYPENNKKFTLVLDLDETLVSFKICPEKNTGILRLRPGLIEFLEEMKKKYELIVFTSATNEYADPLLTAIEKDKKYFDYKLYRQHTIIYNNEIVKDISKIGRPLDKIIIVDNLVQNFRLQKENGIMIKPFWGEDNYDNALIELKDILNKIANEFTDVRIGIKKYKDDILSKVSSTVSKNGIYKL
jgi:Dullard-like phosphatase family protein